MKRILHISDIHFGPNHRPEVSAALVVLARRWRPDLVVISGDLTRRAKQVQFRQAREWIEGFEVPTIAVPGNHDVPMYRFWERLLAPYGAYRKYFSTEMEPVVRLDGILAVGINTAFNWTIKDGRFLKRRLEEVEAILAAAPADTLKVVVAHHDLIPPPRFKRERVAFGSRRAVEVFSRLEVDLILSGHQHQSWVGTTEEYYPEALPPAVVVHSGTSGCSRGRGYERGENSCNWIEADERGLSIVNLRWDPSEGSFRELRRYAFPRGVSRSFSPAG